MFSISFPLFDVEKKKGGSEEHAAHLESLSYSFFDYNASLLLTPIIFFSIVTTNENLNGEDEGTTLKSLLLFHLLKAD
jgi:hypothetical protein